MSKYKFDFTEKLAGLKKQEEASKNYGDQRFWKYSFDPTTKKGSAIIRFLPDRIPSPDGILQPYVKYFSHWFKYHDGNNQQKYIDNCATSIGKECPVCTKNRELFKSPHESDEATARLRKRKVHNVSNILVINDPVNPDNNGKIFLWDYGPQIYSMLSRALYGPLSNDEDFVEGKDYSKDVWTPFDLFTGGNFHLRSTLKKNSDFLTYLPSEWGEKNTPIFPELDDDEREKKLDEIFTGTGNIVTKLDEWLSPSRFPLEGTVRKKLESILGAYKEDDFVEDAPKTSDTSNGEEYKTSKKTAEEKSEKVEEKTSAPRSTEMSDEDYLDNLLGD